MKKTFLIGGATLAVAVAFFLFVRSGLRTVHHAQEVSARRALFVQVEDMLDSQYRQHHKYPAALTDLAITNWPDGSSPATLPLFKYQSDGASYTLACELPQGMSVSTKGPK